MLLNLKTRFKCFLKRLRTPTAILGRRAIIIYIPKITIEASLDIKTLLFEKRSLTSASPDLGVTSLEIVYGFGWSAQSPYKLLTRSKPVTLAKDLKREDRLHSRASDDVIGATAETQLNEIKALKDK